MSKVGCALLLVVMTAMSFQTQAFWFEVPSANSTLSNHGRVDETGHGLDPANIDLLVWNIYKGGLLGWRIDLQRYMQGRDVVLLQEGILNNDMRAEFDASRKHQYTFATSFVFKTSGHATGVVTGATVPADEVIFQRSEGRELVGFSPKMVLINKFPLAGKKQDLMTINIHALNTVSWKKMGAQVLNALRVAKDHDGPVIFAGDFNTWSKKKEEFLKRSMKRAGFKEVIFHNGDERMYVFGRPLDYIFVRDLRVKTSGVLTDATGSDHKPLSATLSYE